MTDLVEFLGARLDEDDEVARATRKNEQRVPGTDRWFASHSNAITSMAPHRAVAEVKAKRRLLDLHEPAETEYIDGDVCMACTAVGDGPHYPCLTLRLLALPYTDHPDYREEWRPGLT